MLFREIIAVYCENHTEHINTLCGQNIQPFTLKQLVHIVTAVLERVEKLDMSLLASAAVPTVPDTDVPRDARGPQSIQGVRGPGEHMHMDLSNSNAVYRSLS
jgi:hypothetical protein